MLRFLGFCLSLLGLVAIIANLYQWSSVGIDRQGCDNLIACYTQAVNFGVAEIATAKIIYYLNLVLMGLLILGMIISIIFLTKKRMKLVLASFFLLALICLQFYLVMNTTVLLKQELVYFSQYTINVLLVSIAVYLAVGHQLNYEKKKTQNRSYFLQIGMGLLTCQLIVGAWLTANHAGLACTGFPQCNGSWWPAVDYRYAFDLLSPLSFTAKVAVNWVHRLLAIANFLTLTWILLSTTQHQVKKVRWIAIFGSFLLLLLVATGIASVKMALPIGLLAAHSILAVLLIVVLLQIYFYTRYASLEYDVDIATFEGISEVDIKDEIEFKTSESLYGRLKSQLGKTRGGFGTVLTGLSLSNRKIDQGLLEEIETSLLVADVGLDVTTEIIAKIEENVEKHQLQDAAALVDLLKGQLLEILQTVNQPLVIPEKEGPYVILVVGINGVGKTTTIGKLAQRLQRDGHSVMLAAGDTFRAAAVEQLQVWGERNHIHVVAQHTGADSASVIFDGVESAKAKGVDVLIADTAGRLHTKVNLMKELKKIKRIISRIDKTAPHEVLLVLDAGTGQNALSQAEHFNKTVNLTGLALTKLDGTAKGGIIFALAKQQGIPVRFLGVGEGIDDLQDFNAEKFIDALFMEDENKAYA
jgi:fused signal recognition particle receptor